MRNTPSLATIILLSMAVLTEGSLDFVIRSRPYDDPVNWNLIEFECTTLDMNGIPSPAANALIYYNESRYPDTFVGENGRVLVRVTRQVEGDYTCRLGSQRSRSIRVVAHPESSITAESRTFEALIGSTARLDCPITPGALVSRYHVRWVNASNQSRIFASIDPTVRNNMVDQRYSINSTNFSLFINNVNISDGAVSYLCLLSVEGSRSRILLYNQTKTARQTLVVIRNPRITSLPKSKVVSTATSNRVRFECEARSFPGRAVIVWQHRGGRVLNSSKKIIQINRIDGESNDFIIQSSLTITNLSRFDSGSVECIAIVSSPDGDETDNSTSILSILDVYSSLDILQTINGDTIIIVKAQQRFLIPMRLNLRLINADSKKTSMTMPPRASDAYINDTEFYLVLYHAMIPFDHFKVEVAFAHENLVGPYSGNGRRYTKFNLLHLAFFIPPCVVAIFLIIFIVFGCIMCLHLKNKALDYQTRLHSMENTFNSEKLKLAMEFSERFENILKSQNENVRNHLYTRSAQNEDVHISQITMRSSADLEVVKAKRVEMLGLVVQSTGGTEKRVSADSGDEGYDDDLIGLAKEYASRLKQVMAEEEKPFRD